MLTYKVEIIEPQAEAKLNEMASEKLIKLSKASANGVDKQPLQRGSMKGLVLYMADDFNAPLNDFEEYM